MHTLIPDTELLHTSYLHTSDPCRKAPPPIPKASRPLATATKRPASTIAGECCPHVRSPIQAANVPGDGNADETDEQAT